MTNTKKILVDSHQFTAGKSTYYGMGRTFMNKIDSVTVDRHRKSIRLLSLELTEKIKKDFYNKINKKNNPNPV